MAKVKLTHALYASWQAGEMICDEKARLRMSVLAASAAGRPALPGLVHPRDLPRRGLGSAHGRISMMHAIAHIEFNAINLALDAVQRFRHLPDDYYTDWLKVADEEAIHFTMVCDWLQHQGSRYGDFDAHNGLWEMAEKTCDDVLERMALVPRVLEARGLDVTPGIMDKVRQAGSTDILEILQRIYADEIGHVAIGTHWYRYLCEAQGLDPVTVFPELLQRHFPGGLHGPFNKEARLQAGFSEQEMQMLQRSGGENQKD
ncbi:MAG: ferritin-like domain-containing protein [Mariprofundaceae bacterium]|nr:ferritin-like domain-containing protein [Mariprofundaceae bacterium]